MASISTVNSMGEIFSDKTPLIAKNKRYVSKSVYMTTVSENENKESRMNTTTQGVHCTPQPSRVRLGKVDDKGIRSANEQFLN